MDSKGLPNVHTLGKVVQQGHCCCIHVPKVSDGPPSRRSYKGIYRAGTDEATANLPSTRL